MPTSFNISITPTSNKYSKPTFNTYFNVIYNNYTNSTFYNFSNTYKASIINHFKQWMNDEYVYGYSCKQYLIMQYFLALILANLIQHEMLMTNNTDYGYYNNKYNLDNKKSNLACNKIKLDDIFTIMGVIFTSCNGGVGCSGIGTSLSIGQPISVPNSNLTYNYIINHQNYYFTIFN